MPSFYSLFKDQLNPLKINTESPVKGFIRLEAVPEDPVDIMAWIANADISDRFYFKNKDNSREIGGLGNAYTILGKTPQAVTDLLYHLWHMDPEIVVFGGMSFFPDQENRKEWRDFAPFRFTLPFLELTRTENNLRVTLNFYQPDDRPLPDIEQDIISRLKKIDAEPAPHAAKPDHCRATPILSPDKDAWQDIISKALTHIKSSEIQKVVLSRKKILKQDHPWNPANILKQLASPEEDSFLFLYQISEGMAFLGRSPERLFKINNRKIAADAIAGSNPRGLTPQEDKDYEHHLLHSPKELEEHRVVTQYIEKQMEMFCSAFSCKEKETILKLKNIQHMISRYSGTLKSRVDPFTVLRSFHPTPAVGGHPSQPAQSLIKTLEPFERGWYAGPVGWMNKDNAEFAVGIRSALVNGKELHVFAGAGIVNQSTALDEWNETENKMANFSCLTGGD